MKALSWGSSLDCTVASGESSVECGHIQETFEDKDGKVTFDFQGPSHLEAGMSSEFMGLGFSV